MSVVNRPETQFDGPSHTYSLKGERLWGISSIAKVGEAEDSYSIGSAWGFRIGYEGAVEVVNDEHYAARAEDPGGHPYPVPMFTPDGMRAELKERGLTPWGTRDRAAARGNWAHGLLEALANTGSVPDTDLLSTVDEEYRGHARAILQFYVDFRPSFVATEVQVTSQTHGFAGRYDIRCEIRADRLRALAQQWLPEGHPVRKRVEFLAFSALCLVDLKTSKRIYPLSHFAQLEGYELGSVEMGFPPTDVRLVLNTHPDGTYDIGVSYATPQDFLGYLAAYKALKGLKALDPEVRREQAKIDAALALLPALSRDIAGKPGCPATAKEVGRLFSKLRKQGKVSQNPDKVWTKHSTRAYTEK